MKVRLLEDWRQYRSGEIAEVSEFDYLRLKERRICEALEKWGKEIHSNVYRARKAA